MKFRETSKLWKYSSIVQQMQKKINKNKVKIPEAEEVGGKSERKRMPNGVKENQKAFSERIKSNGDLVLLES